MGSPCPCGSGRELERCCGEARADPALAYTRGESERALRKMATLLERPTTRRLLQTAEELFWGEFLDEEPEDAEELITHPNLIDSLAGMVFWDMGVWGEQGAAELLLAEPGKRISAGERNFLRAGLASHWSLYEVHEVRAGEGLVLEDLWRPRRVWVPDAVASTQLVRWDVLAGRVFAHPWGEHAFGGDVLSFPCSSKAFLLTTLHEEHERALAEEPELDEGAYWKSMLPTMAQAWILEVARAGEPEVVTPEGDAVVFCTARFAVRDHARLVERLDVATGLVRAEDESWDWIEPLAEGERRLGTLDLEGGVLVLEVHSRERLARAKELLARCAPGCLEHLEDIEELPEERADELADEQPDADGAPQDAEARALVAQHLDAHYRRWLDEPIPMLDDWTPRRAARDERMRPRLVELLKLLENLEERKRVQDGQGYDAGWLWSELGLERPGA